MLFFFSIFMNFSVFALKDTTYVHDFVLLYEGANVHFDLHYQYRLEAFIEFLKKNEHVNAHVRGHVCCGPGKRLSRRRARKMYKFILAHGIAKERLSYRGYSNNAPAVSPEKEDEDEARNRRVDFELTERL